MLISLIVAMARNRVIGRNGQLPWQLPGDLQRFKRLTMGHHLLMGRNTFAAIGRPLPGRRTIVLSRNPALRCPGCTVVGNLQDALALARGEDELFVCGGADIYRQTLPLAQRLYLTEIDLTVPGDSYFPIVPDRDFETLYEECYAEEMNYRFRILQRPSCPVPLAADVKDRI